MPAITTRTATAAPRPSPGRTASGGAPSTTGASRPTPSTGEPPEPGYRLLRAWQRAMDVADAAYRAVAEMPRPARDLVGMELSRAALAVSAHVAASSIVYDRIEQRRAIAAAQHGIARFETAVALGERLAVLPATDVARLLATSADVRRLVRGLARVLAAPERQERTHTGPLQTNPPQTECSGSITAVVRTDVAASASTRPSAGAAASRHAAPPSVGTTRRRIVRPRTPVRSAATLAPVAPGEAAITADERTAGAAVANAPGDASANDRDRGP